MLRYAKRAGARITYAVAWSSGSLRDRAIVASGWTVVPEEPGGIAVVAAGLDERCARAALAGGRPGRSYRVRNTVVTSDGGRLSRDLAIGVAR